LQCVAAYFQTERVREKDAPKKLFKKWIYHTKVYTAQPECLPIFFSKKKWILRFLPHRTYSNPYEYESKVGFVHTKKKQKKSKNVSAERPNLGQ